MQAPNNNEIKFAGAYEMDNFRSYVRLQTAMMMMITIERRCGRKRLKL